MHAIFNLLVTKWVAMCFAHCAKSSRISLAFKSKVAAQQRQLCGQQVLMQKIGTGKLGGTAVMDLMHEATCSRPRSQCHVKDLRRILDWSLFAVPHSKAFCFVRCMHMLIAALRQAGESGMSNCPTVSMLWVICSTVQPNCFACLLPAYQATPMQVIHIHRCRHKDMAPSYGRAIGRVAPGDKVIRSACVDMVLKPCRLRTTTTLLQAKGGC